MKKIYLMGASLIAVIAMSGAVAQTTSSIRYEQGKDNIDGVSHYLDVDLGLPDKQHLVLGYGNSTSLVNNETLETESWYLGWLSNPNADWATGLTYTALNEEKSYELASLRLDLIANTENWAFSISPEMRSIDFFTITSTTIPSGPGPGNGTTSTSDSTINTLSPALGFSASYYGIDRVYIRAGYTAYAYEKAVTTTADQAIFTRVVSASTLNQDYGLEDSRALLAAGFNFGAGYLGVRHTRSVSAVTDITTITNSVYISFRFSEAWRTELSTGTVDDSLTESRFVTAALGYYW